MLLGLTLADVICNISEGFCIFNLKFYSHLLTPVQEGWLVNVFGSSRPSCAAGSQGAVQTGCPDCLLFCVALNSIWIQPFVFSAFGLQKPNCSFIHWNATDLIKKQMKGTRPPTMQGTCHLLASMALLQTQRPGQWFETSMLGSHWIWTLSLFGSNWYMPDFQNREKQANSAGGKEISSRGSLRY